MRPQRQLGAMPQRALQDVMTGFNLVRWEPCGDCKERSGVIDQKREQWEIVTALYGVADIGKP